jgi:hypothetical protein
MLSLISNSFQQKTNQGFEVQISKIKVLHTPGRHNGRYADIDADAIIPHFLVGIFFELMLVVPIGTSYSALKQLAGLLFHSAEIKLATVTMT